MLVKSDASRKRRLIIGIRSILLVTAIAMIVIVQGCRDRAVPKPFGTNMKGIANALLAYAKDEDSLPPADKWCDTLIELDYMPPQQFVYSESDSVIGESDVAINKNIFEQELDRFAPDVVLLFETDFGKEPTGRKELIGNRVFYKTRPLGEPGLKVYKKRWNQAGDSKILTTKYHDQKGCWVAFFDTSVVFVKSADITNLKWK
jgi:hypothetical protein